MRLPLPFLSPILVLLCVISAMAEVQPPAEKPKSESGAPGSAKPAPAITPAPAPAPVAPPSAASVPKAQAPAPTATKSEISPAPPSPTAVISPRDSAPQPFGKPSSPGLSRGLLVDQDIRDIKTDLIGFREEFRSAESNSGNGFATFLLLVLTGMLGYLFWDKFRRRNAGQMELVDLQEQMTEIRRLVVAQSGGNVMAQVPARDNHASELAAKSAELKSARAQVDELLAKLRRAGDSAHEQEQKRAAAIAALEDSRGEARRLQAEVKRLLGDLESAHRSAAKFQEELQALRSALVPASPAGLAASLGDELIASVRGGAPHAVSLLGCLGLIKSADGAGMDEEVLLSTVRQFSESFAAYHADKGASPESIQKGLVAWADALNSQFAGRLDIRVPTLGFPVDSRTMIPIRGATKVSSLQSWCIYNSKGSVFAPAKVA